MAITMLYGSFLNLPRIPYQRQPNGHTTISCQAPLSLDQTLNGLEDHLDPIVDGISQRELGVAGVTLTLTIFMSITTFLYVIG
jgi:hypothetical protein